MNPAVDIATKMHLIMEGIFFVLLLSFTIHSIILGYHWFTYGRSHQTSLTALVIYLCGGAVLFLTMGGSLL